MARQTERHYGKFAVSYEKAGNNETERIFFLIGITVLPKTHHFVVSFDRVLPFKVILNARDRVARSEKSQTEKTEDPDRESSLAIF